MTKNLTLIADHMKEFESDLHQDDFLKEYDHVLSYMPDFKYKSKIQALMRLQRTLSVLLLKLADQVTKDKMGVNDTQNGCGAEVVSEDHADTCFSDYEEEIVLALFRPLQSLLVFIGTYKVQLEINVLVLDPAREGQGCVQAEHT